MLTTWSIVSSAMMAELGLDDISDVSDPDLSDGGAPVQAVKKAGAAESDWDSTVASDLPTPPPRTPRGKPPLSAKLVSLFLNPFLLQ